MHDLFWEHILKKLILVPLIVLMSGCAGVKPYTYNAQSESDPEIIFGDRFGGGKIASPARTFDINTQDAAANKCKDFTNVGTTSNHWMHVTAKTKVIRIPSGKSVAIRSSWLFGTTSCIPRVLMFTPASAGKYSVDIGSLYDKCYLSIVQIKPDGQLEDVKNVVVLPECVKE